MRLRLGCQFLDQHRELAPQLVARRRADDYAPVRLDEVLDEEIELPRQLFDVEGDGVGNVIG